MSSDCCSTDFSGLEREWCTEFFVAVQTASIIKFKAAPLVHNQDIKPRYSAYEIPLEQGDTCSNRLLEPTLVLSLVISN